MGLFFGWSMLPPGRFGPGCPSKLENLAPCYPGPHSRLVEAPRTFALGLGDLELTP